MPIGPVAMKRDGVGQSLKAQRRSIAAFVAKEGYGAAGSIPDSMSFYEWCLELARRGLKVDGKPFDLDKRPSLIPIYQAIPTTREEANRRVLVVQKGAQMGLTIWEMLADLYLAIKFEPLVIGMYLPDINTAQYKSENRFMRFMRSVPDIYHRLVTRIIADVPTKVGEGNVMTRVMGESTFLFLWTSGKVSTESRPMDVLSFDEVQEMNLDDIDKTRERISASDFRFTLMLSTANWPDLDINAWFKRGSQMAFHTHCLACDAMTDLSEHFPKCVAYNAGQVIVRDGSNSLPPANEYVYVCPACQTWIPDPQAGRFIAKNPAETKIISFHISQIISPSITPRDLIEAWTAAVTGDQRKTFYNRKLGKPYVDPDQLPVTMEMCLAAAEEGVRAGLVWEATATDCVMGIDQMGSFNAVVIKRRMSDGRQAVVHVEAVFDIDPFERCADLMTQYGVAMCVVETLPNVNDARKFANRFKGRVFLAGYADLRDDMMTWGDALVSKSDRRTSDEDRTRYTVTLNQYKVMQAALFRIRNRHCLFPDPSLLEQDVIDAGVSKRIFLLRDWVFMHFTKTALVIEHDDETRKPKPKVKKVGLDPHFSYANMLCDVAWARKHGNSMMILPENPAMAPSKTATAQSIEASMPGLPKDIVRMVDTLPPGVCGVCSAFKDGHCTERNLTVAALDPGCVMFDQISSP
jgi:hypothetical protein